MRLTFKNLNFEASNIKVCKEKADFESLFRQANTQYKKSL